MFAAAPIAVVPAQSIDAIDVLPLLARVRRALEACLLVPRLAPVDEQRVSAVYVGLVDLQQRLRHVAGLCHEHDAAGLLVSRADLLARTTVAVALLEAHTARHRLCPRRTDAPTLTAAIEDRITRLEAAYGRSLFA